MGLTGIVGPKWEEFELDQKCPKRARKDRKKGQRVGKSGAVEAVIKGETCF